MKKVIALTFAASALLLAGCCTAHHITKWEYRKAYGIDQVNKLAGDGWIVTGFSAYPSGDSSSASGQSHAEVYLLKRPQR